LFPSVKHHHSFVLIDIYIEGGTIDITVHEVEKTGGVKEVNAACGGGWGGTIVDKAFENMLCDIFTKKIYEKFKIEETEDWLDLWRDFEVKKRAVSPDKSSRINMKFPISLINMYEKVTKQSLSEALSRSKFADDISHTGDKLKFSAEVFKSLFDTSIEKTIGYVKGVIRNTGVKSILMVGGFSESPLLQQAVKSSFPGVCVIIPKDASSAILRGALIFGHSPKVITERVLKNTYGIKTTCPFEKGIHPESKLLKTDDGDMCDKVFHKHVEKNQLVKVGEAQVQRTYYPVNKSQTAIGFSIYASDLMNPQFTDQGCTYVGNMSVDLQDHDGDLSRAVLVSLTFSGTEIVVNAIDKKTGNETNASIDFLG
jgi:molecular chaperone DnaK (HSP70)